MSERTNVQRNIYTRLAWIHMSHGTFADELGTTRTTAAAMMERAHKRPGDLQQIADVLGVTGRTLLAETGREAYRFGLLS